MRLLIRLRSTENIPYEMQYHYHLQGFIYSLLKGSKYHYIHDQEGYKFFCFSNIFPVTRYIEKNDLHSLIISGPDNQFIEYLYDRLLSSSRVEIGIMKFSIDFMNRLDVKIPYKSQHKLITGTPIIVRIPREKYRMYGISPSKDYDYIYWRSHYPVVLFLSQVESNLVKKFIEFAQLNDNYRSEIERYNLDQRNLSPSLFQRVKFKKQVSTRVFMKGLEQVIIGTLWEITFNLDINKDLVYFALDSGLGERNSLGFGFMNVMK